eukprot:scaffold2375_cov107-Isochrysis_galbana.AAC.6
MAPAGKSSATARLFRCLRAFLPSGIAGDRPRPMRRAFRRSPARCEHCLRCQPTRGQFPARVPGKLQALCMRGLSFGLLRSQQQAAINLSHRLGPGQRSQQLPDTPHNPKLTSPGAVLCAGPVSLPDENISAIEGAAQPKS